MLALLTSCSRSEADETAYAQEWKQIAVEFDETAKRHAAQPLPNDPTAPRSEKLRVLSERIIREGNDYEPLAKRARELNAPKKYEEHKAALVSLLEGLVKLNVAYGTALTGNDRAKAEAVGAEIDQHLYRSFERIVKALEDLGLDANQWKSELDSLRASQG